MSAGGRCYCEWPGCTGIPPADRVDDETGRYICCGTDALGANPFHAAGCPLANPEPTVLGVKRYQEGGE